MAVKKKSNSKSSNVGTVITILILIAAASLITSVYVMKDDSSGILELPAVNFYVNSKEDGKPHNFSIKFNLEGDVDALKDLNEDKIEHIIMEAMSKSDYESLKGADSVEYVRQIVINELNSQFPEIKNKEIDFTGVYIDEFTDGIANKNPDIQHQDSQSNKNHERLKGLFKNME